MDKKTLASMLDATLLKHDAPFSDIDALCREAIEYDYFGVCIFRKHIDFAFQLLEQSTVHIVSVAGFPTGRESTKEKCDQSIDAIRAGADEIDVVCNIGWLFEKNYKQVLRELREVLSAMREAPLRRDISESAILKVIIETAALRDEERKTGREEGSLIRAASEIVAEAEADFVKTSTGMYKSGGVQDNDVSIIRSVVGDHLKIKAAGGIKDWKHASKLIDEGADRLGTSKAKVILEGLLETQEKEN